MDVSGCRRQRLGQWIELHGLRSGGGQPQQQQGQNGKNGQQGQNGQGQQPGSALGRQRRISLQRSLDLRRGAVGDTASHEVQVLPFSFDREHGRPDMIAMPELDQREAEHMADELLDVQADNGCAANVRSRLQADAAVNVFRYCNES